MTWVKVGTIAEVEIITHKNRIADIFSLRQFIENKLNLTEKDVWHWEELCNRNAIIVYKWVEDKNA